MDYKRVEKSADYERTIALENPDFEVLRRLSLVSGSPVKALEKEDRNLPSNGLPRQFSPSEQLGQQSQKSLTGEFKQSNRPKVTWHDRAPVRKFDRSVGSRKLTRKGANGVNLPPEITNVPVYSAILRFYVNATTARVVTAGDLFGAAGVICYQSNAMVRSINCSLRIRRVSIYPSNGASVRMGWYHSGGYGKDVEYDRTIPANVSVTAPTHSSPPKQSLCGDWFDAALSVSTQMFEVYCSSAGSILDLEYDAVLNGVDFGPNFAVSTGLPGNAYWMALDDAYGGTPLIIPINRPTTT